MKINPVGIQSYQQVDHRERPAASAKDSELKPNQDKTVSIAPQSETTGSRLAVKAPQGNYSEFLTAEEKQAMDMLFAKYRNSERFGLGYQRDGGDSAVKKSLGNVVDVKV